MDLDTVLLARIQFAANISFHILFPTITIALGWILLFFKLRYAATRDEAWMDAYRLYVKVFALTFALGVVSGITMSFQFGTNWPGFMERVGNIAGPLLAYEVLTAFFLEAAFLGIMLFGLAEGARLAAHAGDRAGGGRRRPSPPSGSSRSIPGCTRPPASRSATAWSMRRTGFRSFSTLPCPTGSPTCCWPRA
jgi:hypothetical protein